MSTIYIYINVHQKINIYINVHQKINIYRYNNV